MEIFKCTESQPHWYVTNRKPTKCVNCGKKEVRPSMFGMPTAEAAHSGKWHIAGCMPDMPEHRTWGCCNCRGYIPYVDPDKLILNKEGFWDSFYNEHIQN